MFQGINPTKYGQFDHGEISFILGLMCRMKTNDEIMLAFRSFSPDDFSKLTVRILQDLRLEFAAQIAKKASIYIKYVEGSPLSHERLVLDMYHEIIVDSRIERPIPNAFDQNGIPLTKPDNTSAIKALTCATQYLREQEKLKLEKLKLAKPILPANIQKQAEETHQNLNQTEPMESNQAGGWEIF